MDVNNFDMSHGLEDRFIKSVALAAKLSVGYFDVAIALMLRAKCALIPPVGFTSGLPMTVNRLSMDLVRLVTAAVELVRALARKIREF